MSWLNLALGLIREAATTEAGQEILNDIRSGATRPNARSASPGAGTGADDNWVRRVESRLEVSDRNAEMLVRMLNAQDEALVRVQKRQRIWNLTLATAILLAAGALVVLWIR